MAKQPRKTSKSRQDTKDMQLSPMGLLEIAEHEGVVLGPYLDSVGYWTYGVGHTASAGPPDSSDMPRVDTRNWSDERVEQQLVHALKVFDADLEKFETRVRKYITSPLHQYEFDALVSFDFNTGGLRYKRKGRYVYAKLTDAINADDMSGDQFMGWVKPKEIIGRRKSEQALFRTGDYAANGTTIPLYDALGDGRIRRRGTIDGTRLQELMGGDRKTVDAGTLKAVDEFNAKVKAERKSFWERLFG